MSLGRERSPGKIWGTMKEHVTSQGRQGACTAGIPQPSPSAEDPKHLPDDEERRDGQMGDRWEEPEKSSSQRKQWKHEQKPVHKRTQMHPSTCIAVQASDSPIPFDPHAPPRRASSPPPPRPPRASCARSKRAGSRR